ncbi:metal ABC transporter permease [Candidatus Saccharibacteria bacterium]|nr:metal ABC transporter permease [Candidatus Saccharibacteria bacterium]
MNQLVEMFSYPFMVRACLAGLLISFCAALIGVPLVLRKKSMLGDGLSHAAFGACAIAVVMGLAPIWFAIPVVMLASFVILSLRSQRHGDASLALLSASALAIGTFAISLSSGVNIDLNSYLFGSVLSVSTTDLVLATLLTLAVIVVYLFAHNRIFAITFDADFARAIGVKTRFYDLLFSALCSVVVVVGMRLLGALLISSLIVFPTLIAMQFCKSFHRVVLLAVVFSLVNFLVGFVASYLLATPTGATIVITNLIVLIFAKLIGIKAVN